jgi:SAM-dependent methyltransferase
MTVLCLILATALVLDALRMRARLTRLPRLSPSGEPVSAEHRFLCAPGVALAETTRRAASNHMRQHGLLALDLVPADLPAPRALALAQLLDPARYRRDRLATGVTAGHVVVVSTDLLARADVAASATADPVSFLGLAIRLKRYACTDVDLAVAPDLCAVAEDPNKRLAIYRALLRGATPFVLAFQLLVLAVLGVGLVFAPLPGGVTLAAFHGQSLIALASTALSPRGGLVFALGRFPLELASWLRTVAGRWRPPGSAQPDQLAAELRPAYRQLLAEDPVRFFEPRRTTCPLCASSDLTLHLRTRDLLQHKPGRFALERCRACQHIFQNPRLSLAGLDFYYRDFYDGLGEAHMDFIFGYTSESYLGRARMLEDVARPARWLDVGAGHGHFCNVARDVWPTTRFDGLDLSASIDEAARRRWIDTAYKGLFPDLAESLTARYDVVSMGHYLEHTTDPVAEIDAAHRTLVPGGHLLIEVPDPQSLLGRLLGRFWIPWFQPQHLHLLSRANLERVLVARGFQPVAWARRGAHQRVDFVFAVLLGLGRLAPQADLPWRQPSRIATAWRATIFALGAPLLALGRGLDVLLAPLVSRTMSNTYRVLARKL